MVRVKSVMPLEGYSLDVTFTDGTRGTLCLAGRLFGPVFEPLKDPALFAEAKIDEFGAVCWPNGADLAPDAMWEQVRSGLRVA